MPKHSAKNAPIRRPLFPSVLTLTLTGQGSAGPSPHGPFELVSELGYAGYRLLDAPVLAAPGDDFEDARLTTRVVIAGDTCAVAGLTLRVVTSRRRHEDHVAALSEFMDEMGIPCMLIEAAGQESVLLQFEEDQGTQ